MNGFSGRVAYKNHNQFLGLLKGTNLVYCTHVSNMIKLNIKRKMSLQYPSTCILKLADCICAVAP